MKINIWKIPWGYKTYEQIRKTISFRIERKGYIELESFDPDECWHLCNWSCWAEVKPNNLNSDLDVANSDVIFHNPEEDKYYLALPFGWHIDDSLENIINYVNN